MNTSTRRRTGFLSHYDCSRHDTGWGHPDHQGRLPALMRAVHADMLTLFDALAQLDGRHATAEELLLAHEPDYLRRVEEWSDAARAAGSPWEVEPRLVASAATWEASIAAVGTAIRGAEAVLAGEVENAFCAIRPAARDAGSEAPGRYGFLNQLASTARMLLRQGAKRILVVRWGGGDVRLPAVAGDGEDLRIVDASGFREVLTEASGNLPTGSGADPPDGPSRGGLVAATRHALQAGTHGFAPDFVLLSAGFDGLAGDREGHLYTVPCDYHGATRAVVEYARAECGGRLLSILEGGYSDQLGAAVINHLRGLAGLQPTEI